MEAVGRIFNSPRKYERAQKAARLGAGPASRLPGPLKAWSEHRELPDFPKQTFREWWRERA